MTHYLHHGKKLALILQLYKTALSKQLPNLVTLMGIQTRNELRHIANIRM
jgi:hypothetical protein